jgi:hypothetical protein
MAQCLIRKTKNASLTKNTHGGITVKVSRFFLFKKNKIMRVIYRWNALLFESGHSFWDFPRRKLWHGMEDVISFGQW